MNLRFPTTRAAAVTGIVAVAALVATSAAPAVAAENGGVSVVNTETVQTYTDATGAPQSSRLYEQLAFTGAGSVDVTNPVVADGLRNLDGFGGLELADGAQVVEMEVDGSENLRTVSDFDGDLPLAIDVVYLLDGEQVEPADLVGATGELEVRYTVSNVTGRVQTVTFDDGKGGEATREVTVAVPMVGSLSTTLPGSFRDVTSEQANMAGDGRGGTKLSFTMTLVPPVGSDTVSFGYTAQIEDAVLPRASVTALPVNPLQSPTFKTAAESYAGGAATGARLADGAAQIDENLLKLRDGAGELLGGLLQLRDGAEQLQDGLQGKAAPGSQKLAAGAGDLSDGLGQLDEGAGKLADGSGRLADGASAAAQGSRDLTEGLGRLSAGLDQLAAVDGLPAAQQGIAQLQAGVTALRAGLGSADDPTTLVGGLAKLQGGLGQLETGSGQLVGGLDQLAAGLPQAKGGVDQVKAGLDSAIAAGGSLDQLIGGLTSLKSLPSCAGDPVCAGTVDALLAGAKTSKSNLTAASAGLGQVSTGLTQAVTGLTGQILPGARQLQGGLQQASAGAGDLQAGAVRAGAGLDQVSGGLDTLAAGLGGAVAGVFQLADGASAAYAGGGQLSDGLGQLDAGAGELSSGAGLLADGTGRAAAGSEELAAGARKLAEGLTDAAEGSGLLADGLGKAAEGAPKLVDGAQRLSDEGTSQLVKAGEETAQEYGAMYATLEAGAERAEAESMVVGAPEEAIGLAAYTFEIQGEDGEGQRNAVRGLAALGLLAAAAGTVVLRRRMHA